MTIFDQIIDVATGGDRTADVTAIEPIRQFCKVDLPISFAGQVGSAVPAASVTLARDRRLRPNDFGLDGGRKPFCLAERQTECFGVCPVYPFDPRRFDLGRRSVAEIGLELQPACELLHRSAPLQ